MGIFAMWDAYQLSKDNQERADDLKHLAKKLTQRAKSLEKKYAGTLEAHFDEDLGPFAVLFARIKNCELNDVDVLARVPAVGAINPQTRSVSINALQGMASLAGGAAAGAGAGALTFAAVGAFATASTGTAIAGLSGAAATSATLAWLGGGSLAAGGLGMAGGAAVLTGVVALPVLVAFSAFVWWAGEKELAKQRQVAAKLKEGEAVGKRDGKLLDTVAKQVKSATDVLEILGDRIDEFNDWLERRLDVNDDYLTFDETDRQKLAVHVSLVTAMTAVMASPLVVVDHPGTKKERTKLNPEFQPTVDQVEQMLQDLGPTDSLAS